MSKAKFIEKKTIILEAEVVTLAAQVVLANTLAAIAIRNHESFDYKKVGHDMNDLTEKILNTENVLRFSPLELSKLISDVQYEYLKKHYSCIRCCEIVTTINRAMQDLEVVNTAREQAIKMIKELTRN